MLLPEETQGRVLSYLAQSPNRDILFPFLSERWFDSQRNKDVFKILQIIWRKHKQIPSELELKSILNNIWKKKKLSILVQEDWLASVTKIYHTEVTNATVEEIAEVITRKRISDWTLLAASKDQTSHDIIPKIRDDLDNLQNLLNVHVSKEDLVSMLDPEYVKAERIKRLQEPVEVIPLGFPRIDQAAAGGLMRGELCVVMAPTNGGKTMFLINVAANLVRAGYSVMYINLDTPIELVQKRLYACITGMSMNEETTLEELESRLLDYIDINNLDKDCFVYKDLIPNTVSVSTLRGIVRRYDLKIIPRDVIIVDYGDLIIPDKHSNEKRHGLAETFEGLRGLAKELNKVVVTATQSNRDGVEKILGQVVTLKNISEAYAKAFPCSLGLAINQTISERTFNPPCCRISIFKNTKGERDLIIPFIADYPRARIYPDTEGVVQSLMTSVRTTYSDNSEDTGETYMNRSQGKFTKTQSVTFGNDRYMKSKSYGDYNAITDYPAPD